jgi:DNA-binding response OmpR family regulator
MGQQTDSPAASGRILVVDDDPSVRAMLVEYLGSHRYEVRAAGSGELMRAEIERDLPDLILLDVRLPGEDGLTLARFLRERFDVGIIMVTASGDVIDRVVGLEVGADDYVAKPFDPRELLARVKSVLRRMQARPRRGREPVSEPTASGLTNPAPDGSAPQPDRAQPSGTAQRVRVGRCWLDPDGRRLFERDGTEVAITAMEFELLGVFLANPNRVLSRDQLLQRTRNRDWEPFDRSIDIRIGRLRRKIEPPSASGPLCIRTVRNAGYLYVPLADGPESPA